jgi:hypothetical protein
MSAITAAAQSAATLRDPAILQQIAKLAQTDREVKAHEQAHMAAAGGLATSGPSFQYTTGPDGKRYAVAGEVNIDTSPVPGDPQATLRKARLIQAAAHAPVDPSSQDQAVAAAAAQMAAQARVEAAYKAREDVTGSLFSLSA